VRTVGIKLQAEVANYIAGVKESAKATDGLVDELQKAARAGDETAVATEVFGKTAKTAAGHVEKLDHEIKQAERELRQLAVAFAEAETAADRADLSKNIRKTQTELTKLKQNKNVLKNLIPKEVLDDVIPNSQNSPGIFKRFSSSLTSAFEGGIGPAEVVPALAALAPLIGGVISAGIIGGAGVGGVIGGVLLAARDARVKAAGTELGQNLLGQLTKDADVFIGPVLRNIGKIEAAFGSLNGQIKNIFGGSAGFLDPLVNGAIGGIRGILGGIEALVAKGKPVIDALGQSFTTIGSAVGSALKTIAGGSESAATALNDFANDVAVVIKGVGWAVRGLTELYNAMMLPTHLETEWFFKWKTGIDYMAAKTPVASAAVDALGNVLPSVVKGMLSAGEAAGKAGLQMQTFADKMDEAAAKGRGLYDSQTDVAQAIADTTKAVKENGRTLDLNTQKGRDNRKALSDLAGKLEENFKGYVKVGIGSSEASARANDARATFIRVATQMGATKTQAGALADEMGLIKTKKIDFLVNTHDAVGRLNAARDAINRIHGKTVEVHVSVTGTERLNALGHRIGGAATGGPIEGPGTTTSDSIPMMLSRGEHVWTAREVAAAGGQAAVSALRASVLSGSPRAMPANFGPQKVIVETRNVVEFVGGADAFGQLMAYSLRVKPGVRATIAKTLKVPA
jgi:predicted  nucleic acid-binding Zn-ribbon protein